MDDLVDIVGLADLLTSAGINPSGNFEELYSQLSALPEHGNLVDEINQRLDAFFASLELPDYPTIYDALVLSLRSKDLIATFNWDPFLFQASLRNHRSAQLPRVAYLHGNVAIGYCLEHHTKGMRSSGCSACRRPYTASRLLYPIAKKAYSTDPFIKGEWKALQRYLEHAFMLTIFGYSAPQADVEAMTLMSNAWGDVLDRNFEQTELIDVREEEELRTNWSHFIHTHHYDVFSSFYDSWIATHPRRTCEAAWQQFFEAKFIARNPIPQTRTLDELWAWFGPLCSAEAENNDG
jgi:hypothetical protein